MWFVDTWNLLDLKEICFCFSSLVFGNISPTGKIFSGIMMRIGQDRSTVQNCTMHFVSSGTFLLSFYIYIDIFSKTIYFFKKDLIYRLVSSI